ncbi:MAG: hypothetical protein AB7D57_11460 [Desulfovibrionaceae bacterium]
MVDRFVRQGREYVVVVRAGHVPAGGIEFFTPPDYSQQMGAMLRPAGHVIPAHVHNETHREVTRTCEALFVRRGRVRTDVYDEAGAYLGGLDLGPGDVALFVRGGHGFTMLEESDIVEIKQGPHVGDSDKTRIPCVADEDRCPHGDSDA